MNQPGSKKAGQSRADRLREYLLPVTVSKAVEHSAFYRERIGALGKDVRGLADLGKLPLLRRSDLRDRLGEMTTVADRPDYLLKTSGTTGEPLDVPVYRRELETYERLVSSAVFAKLGIERPLTVTIVRIGDRSEVALPQSPALPCHIDYDLDQLLYMLAASHSVNGTQARVNHLKGAAWDVRRVTRELMARKIDPRRFGLEAITCYGQYLAQSERRFLENVWGAPVSDHYGVTEVQGNSRRCRRCEYYHFDFIVIPEVLDPGTEEPIEDGVGQLVLTGLYPFSEGLPMIRYLVGDIVEIRRTNCGSPEPGIRFKARIGDAVPAPPGSAVPYRLFSTDVAEALADLPDVARDSSNASLRFSLSSTQAGEALVEIELSYPPRLYPERVEELRSLVVDVLKERSAAPGDPEIVFVRPGELKKVTAV